jgi:hypothetical protein
MSAEYLASVAGIVLSLGFAYIPKLKDWYDLQTSQRKVQVMGAALVIVAGGAFGLACAQIATLTGLAITCDVPGAVSVIKVLIAALVANQATYLLMVRPFKRSNPADKK